MASSDAERRREARRRAAARRVEPDAAPAGAETALRSKPVRVTADLAPELYRRLDRLTSRAAEDIDAAKVSTVDLFRAFIRASDDPDVWSKVLTELRQAKQ